MNRHRQAVALRELEPRAHRLERRARRGASDGGSGSRRRSKRARNGCAGDDAGHRAASSFRCCRSRGAPSAARSPRSPTPRDDASRRRARESSAPSARRTPAVEWTSAESRMPRTRDSPSASAARISARCEIDLSPGTRDRPGNSSSQPSLRAPSRGRSSRRGTSRSPASGARCPAPRPTRLAPPRARHDDRALGNLERRVRVRRGSTVSRTRSKTGVPRVSTTPAPSTAPRARRCLRRRRSCRRRARRPRSRPATRSPARARRRSAPRRSGARARRSARTSRRARASRPSSRADVRADVDVHRRHAHDARRDVRAAPDGRSARHDAHAVVERQARAADTCPCRRNANAEACRVRPR